MYPTDGYSSMYHSSYGDMGNKRWLEADEYDLIEIIIANFKYYTTGMKNKFYVNASTSHKTKTSTPVKSK